MHAIPASPGRLSATRRPCRLHLPPVCVRALRFLGWVMTGFTATGLLDLALSRLLA